MKIVEEEEERIDADAEDAASKKFPRCLDTSYPP